MAEQNEVQRLRSALQRIAGLTVLNGDTLEMAQMIARSTLKSQSTKKMSKRG